MDRGTEGTKKNLFRLLQKHFYCTSSVQKNIEFIFPIYELNVHG